MLFRSQSTRHAIITDVGLDFKLYKEKYVGMSKKALRQVAELTEPQRKAIIKANKVKPIKLTPEMIFKRGRGAGRRVPLGTNPTTKKRYGVCCKVCQNIGNDAFNEYYRFRCRRKSVLGDLCSLLSKTYACNSKRVYGL